MLNVSDKRAIALEAFNRALDAANPHLALQDALGKWLQNDGKSVKSIIPVAVGKAACSLMEGLLDMIPVDKLKRSGLIITNSENRRDVQGAEVHIAGHPLPDQDGLAATEILMEIVKNASEEDHILFCVSGGASAMLPAPREGLSLTDKIEVTNQLLACGADIAAINIVRKHLSDVKGGGLVKLAAPAKVTSFILSDVVGDDLSAIASGPSVPDSSTFQDAKDILDQYGIWTKVPATVCEVISAGIACNIPETLKADDQEANLIDSYLIGSNMMSVVAARSYMEEVGVDLLEVDYPLEGNAREEAVKLVKKISENTLPRDKTYALITGGETTVNLTGSGKGGRNQEFALAFLLYAMEKKLTQDWVCLSGGTDGRDGPTDAAGGMTDQGSFMRMMKFGVNPVSELENNNAYDALRASGDLILTGGTGTNVADVQVVLF